MRFSASISLAVHLLFIFSASVLFSGVQIPQPALRYVKVTFHPMDEEKKPAPEVSSPPPAKDPGKKPERKEVNREENRAEPVPSVQKDETKPPVLLPVQTVEKEIPAEEPKPVSPPHEEEKIVKEPPAPTVVAVVGSNSPTPKEEDLTSLLPSSLPGPMPENKPSGAASGEGAVMGHGGPPGGGSGNGSGGGKTAFYWKDSPEGTGTGQRGPSGTGTGTGSGTGTGWDQGSGGGGFRKGAGILGKLFPSAGGTGGSHPRYAENPKPPYPREAREKGYHGEVLLRVEVLSNGRVGQIEVSRSSGHEILDRSALSTVKQWRFIPAKKGDEPIPLWVNIPVRFQLQ